MQCPRCTADIQDDALKCDYCRQVIITGRENKKNTVWYSIASVFFALVAALFCLIAVLSTQGEVARLTPEYTIPFFILYCCMCAASMLLSFWSIKRRYTAWWLCCISILILAWSILLTKNL